jgi:hypothetical protein
VDWDGAVTGQVDFTLVEEQDAEAGCTRLVAEGDYTSDGTSHVILSGQVDGELEANPSSWGYIFTNDEQPARLFLEGVTSTTGEGRVTVQGQTTTFPINSEAEGPPGGGCELAEFVAATEEEQARLCGTDVYTFVEISAADCNAMTGDFVPGLTAEALREFWTTAEFEADFFAVRSSSENTEAVAPLLIDLATAFRRAADGFVERGEFGFAEAVDLLVRVTELQNRLRNLSPCERWMLGDDDWEHLLGRVADSVINAAASSDLGFAEIASLVALARQTGVSADPLAEATQRIIDDNTSCTSDTCILEWNTQTRAAVALAESMGWDVTIGNDTVSASDVHVVAGGG